MPRALLRVHLWKKKNKKKNLSSADMSNMILSHILQGINSYAFQSSKGQIMLYYCYFQSLSK